MRRRLINLPWQMAPMPSQWLQRVPSPQRVGEDWSIAIREEGPRPPRDGLEAATGGSSVGCSAGLHA